MEFLMPASPGRPAKVPEVVLSFWVIKIAATTLGETGGDTLSMSFNLGYAASSCVFAVIFLIAVGAQIRARSFHPWLYWGTIVATTLVGTTMADFADRSLGIGYVGGSSVLFALVLLVLGLWRISSGSVSVENIRTFKDEAFYWATILASNTLGTALGDLLSDDTFLGFAGGTAAFSAMLLFIAGLYRFTRLSHTLLFWAAFVLTRPLGATMGDLLTKPIAHGGFDLSRPASSAIIACGIIALILLIPQRAGGHPARQSAV
jgi:uncharacterized membrane-anchored protein